MDLETHERLEETRREWADLPEELLKIISSNLFAKDLQNFSLVCQSWYEAVEVSYYRRSLCLMLYDMSLRMWKFYQHDRTFFISLPELDSAYICSSNYGWLLMSRENGTLFFFDPFNGRRKVEVPGTVDGDYTTIHFFHPPTSPKCFLIGIKNVAGSNDHLVKIGILKRGKDSWESWVCGSSDQFTVTLSAPVLHNGLLYLVDVKGDIATVDVERVESSWRVHSSCLGDDEDPKDIRQHFLVEMAVDHLNEEEDDKDEKAVHGVFVADERGDVYVYRLLGNMKWERVTFLGRRAMNLSQGCSIGYRHHFNYLVDCLFFPKFKDDEIALYSLQVDEYQPYSFPGDGFSHASAYGLRGLDFGVTWILPASPTDLHLPTVGIDEDPMPES